MNIQFVGYIFAVRDDRVRGDTEHICYLFIAQTSYYLNQYIFFSLG